MKTSEIKRILRGAGIECDTNLYPDEPGPRFNYVAVAKGRGDEAIRLINANGGEAMWVPACSHVYADNIQVERKSK